MNRLVTVLLVFSAAISIPAMLFVLMAGYEILVAPPVVEYRGVPFAIITSPVAAGDPVQLVVTRCANDPLSPNPISYEITRDIVNVETHTKYVIPSGAVTMPHGCETITSTLSLLPMGIPAGHYFLEGTTIARGLLKTSTVAWQTDVFEVR